MKKVTPKPTKGVKVGQKVFVPELGIFAEVAEISDDVKGWITKVKRVKDDGTVEFLEVTSLVVHAVQILEKVYESGIIKRAWIWFTNFFRKKHKRKPIT